MGEDLNERLISAEKAKKILEECGMKASLEEARAIVNFMYKISSLAIKLYLIENDKG